MSLPSGPLLLPTPSVFASFILRLYFSGLSYLLGKLAFYSWLGYNTLLGP